MLEARVAYRMSPHGAEIKIDSLQNDGYQSWMVISRGINKYATDLLEENEKPIHCEEVAPVRGDPLRQNRRNNSLSTIVVPIDQQSWKDIPAVEDVA